jgi:hypothetical protein
MSGRKACQYREIYCENTKKMVKYIVKAKRDIVEGV